MNYELDSKLAELLWTNYSGSYRKAANLSSSLNRLKDCFHSILRHWNDWQGVRRMVLMHSGAD